MLFVVWWVLYSRGEVMEVVVGVKNGVRREEMCGTW